MRDRGHGRRSGKALQPDRLARALQAAGPQAGLRPTWQQLRSLSASALGHLAIIACLELAACTTLLRDFRAARAEFLQARPLACEYVMTRSLLCAESYTIERQRCTVLKRVWHWSGYTRPS